MGRFRNQKLVAWCEPDKDYSDSPAQDTLPYRPPDDLWLEPNGVYCTAAVLTDTIGREYVVPSYFSVAYHAAENFVDRYDDSSEGAWEY